jgi:UDP-N-acetylmuramyl pentapeptide phosphotransferase/UDP-N-acetylglucosamine-1-phosphate transferase
MHLDITMIVLLLIATYFLVAAFVPRIRMRWGVSISPKRTVLKPHMGMVSCLGIAIFISAFALPMIAPRISGDWVGRGAITGFVLFFIGGVIDSLGKTKTITRKKGKTQLPHRNP